MSRKLWGLPLYDIAIPVLSWAIIASYYIYQMLRRVSDNRAAIFNMKKHNYYHHNYFYHVSAKCFSSHIFTIQLTHLANNVYIYYIHHLYYRCDLVGSTRIF